MKTFLAVFFSPSFSSFHPVPWSSRMYVCFFVVKLMSIQNTFLKRRNKKEIRVKQIIIARKHSAFKKGWHWNKKTSSDRMTFFSLLKMLTRLGVMLHYTKMCMFTLGSMEKVVLHIFSHVLESGE